MLALLRPKQGFFYFMPNNHSPASSAMSQMTNIWTKGQCAILCILCYFLRKSGGNNENGQLLERVDWSLWLGIRV